MKLSKFACLVITLYLVFPKALIAQAIEEVLVTAQKREQNLQDISLTISAFNEEDIKSFGFGQPGDIAQQSPGVYVKPTVGDQNPVFTIRGIGFNDFTSIQNPGAGVYVNQVIVPYHPMMSFQLLDLKRVEVLKGPQGTLYGRNSTAGAINFISNKPTRDLDIRANAGYSSYDTWEFEGAIGGGLTDTIAGRLAASTYQRTGGYQTNRLGGDDEYGSKDRTSIRGMLSWEPSENFDALIDIHAGFDKSDPVALEHLASFDAVTFAEPCAPVAAGMRAEGPCVDAGGYFDPDDDPFSGDYSVIDGGVDNKAWGVSATMNWEMYNGLTLTSVTGYDRYFRNQLQDIDAGPFVFIDVTFNDKTWTLSQELRLTSNSSGNFNWLAGVFYSSDSVDAIQSVDVTDLAGDVAVISNFQDSESVAVFGHFEWELSELWQVVGGIRYTHEEKDWTGGSVIGVLGVNTQNTASVENDDVSGTIGLEYRPNNDWLLYTAFSKGFRSGGFPGGFAPVAAALEPFQEETVFSYEGGFKAMLLEGSMQLNAAAYFYDWQDLQTQFSEARGGLISLFLGNAGDAEITGIEAELKWLPTDQLELRAGINWNDTEIVESDDPRLEGRELANAPELTFNTFARYSFPVTSYRAYIQMDVSYTDDRFFTSDNTPVFFGDDYWLVNARIGFRTQDDRWELAGWVKNLTDEEYRLEGFNQFGFSGDSYHYYGEPLTAGISISYQY